MEQGYGRRGFMKTALLVAASYCLNPMEAMAVCYSEGDSLKWDYTLKEMAEVYEKEYQEGEHLKNHVTSDCVVTSYGKRGKIPEDFIVTTLKHLEGMLRKDWARYIFRLDAYHSHLFLEDDIRRKYVYLSDLDLIQGYVQEKGLGALYHNAEHLALRSPLKIGEIDPEAIELKNKRNVIGWYDGRPLEQTRPLPTAKAKLIELNRASVPEGYSMIGKLKFKAHRNGVFSIRPFDKEIRIDFSFDDLYYY